MKRETRYALEAALVIREELGGEVMVKAQAWVTGRASLGGIKKASNPAQAEEAAKHMLGMKVKNFVVEEVLVEQSLQGIVIVARDQIFVGAAVSQAAALGISLGMVIASSLSDSPIDPLHAHASLSTAAIAAAVAAAWATTGVTIQRMT